MKNLIPAGLIVSAFALAAFVPETSGWALMVVVFGAVGGILRRRRAATLLAA